jgi:hypothetical protein
MMAKCASEGCGATTETPGANGWRYLFDWGHGIETGDYCPAHADALEAVLMEGGFDDPENDLQDDKPDEEDGDEADLQKLAAELCVTEGPCRSGGGLSQ